MYIYIHIFKYIYCIYIYICIYGDGSRFAIAWIYGW